MQRERRPVVDTAERLVYFTDAVVAIALTLLVLPLVDLVPEASRESADVRELLLGHLAEIGAFLLSFAVIFRFWWAHHRLFRHVSLLSAPLVAWSVLWTLSIVVLPVPTAIITAYAPSPTTVALYTGTLVLTSGSLMMLAITVFRDPRLSTGRRAESREELLGIATAFGLQLVALVVGTVFASTIAYGALSLMLLSGPFEHLVKRYWASHPRRTGTPSP